MEEVNSIEPEQSQYACPGSVICAQDFDTSSNPSSQISVNAEFPPVIQKHLWAIVLAGGEGERLRPLTEKWLGCHCPKQYCTFVGNRSMLEHTLDRTCEIVSPARVLTVVSCNHMKWLETGIVTNIPGRMIKQPLNLDTGPGIFLPATYIFAADPAATILIFPSDHFIFPRERFLKHIAELATLANRYTDQILMLGVKPDRAEADYGWIEPGQRCVFEKSKNAARWVSAFREKPAANEAMKFLEKGYLWNTMIMAVRAGTLWKLGHQYFPETMELFELLKSALKDNAEEDRSEAKLSAIYRKLRPENFSRGLLQRAVGHTVVSPMDDVDWDDWGRPERIVNSLARIGRRPDFSFESLISGGQSDVQNRTFANA